MSTAKDYIAVAKAIAAQRDREIPEVENALDALAEDLAEYYQEDSPTFKRAAFLKAAGAA